MTTRYPAATAALELLAAALDQSEFATTLTSHPGQPPCLAVTSRRADIGGDIHADHRAYWWSWGERIAPVTDPPAAARKISGALRAIPAGRP
jgi:hypothetical protein